MMQILTLFLITQWSCVVCASLDDPPQGAELRPQVASSSGTAAADLVPVPEPTEKAIRFHRSGNCLWLAVNAWTLLVLALLLGTGLSARLRGLAARVGRVWFLTVGVYAVLLTGLLFVINLPLTFYLGFVRLHAYGLSNQTFGKWLRDQLIATAIEAVVLFLVLWIPYLLLRKSPRRWWLYTSILAVPFICFSMFVFPVWVAPLFNRFGPMKDKALEQRILELAQRAGVDGGRVFEVEKSVDTKAVNAYVAGFMNTKRIVLWDTLLAKLEPDEVLVVMGHEMGHYVLGHVVQGIVLSAAGLFIALFVAHRTCGWVIARFRHRLGFDSLADVASYPLLLLLGELLTLAGAPIGLAVSRHMEHEADRFALEATRANRAAAMAFVKLQTENLAVSRPHWLYKLWRASHPPIGERIEFCNSYRPWARGQPLRYARFFSADRVAP